MWRAAVVLAVVFAAVPAYAHTGDPTIVARIDAVTPPLPGVRVQVRSGVADQLLLVNATDTTVEVIGTDGGPFLRIAKDRVEADVASPDWTTSNDPIGTRRPPARRAAPEWRVVSRGGSWGWFDHRLHETPRVVTRDLRAAGRVARLAEWSVPLRYGTTNAVVSGHVEYRPVAGAFRTRVTQVPEGAAVDALDGRVPGLFVRWSGAGTLTLRGIGGEPLARFSASGTEVNDASQTWQDSLRLQGTAERGPVDPARPRWSAAPAHLTWLDRRLAYQPGLPPDDVARKQATLVEWDVPGDVDGVPVHVRGETTWYPADPERRGGARPVVLLGVALLVAGGGLVALRRRAQGRA